MPQDVSGPWTPSSRDDSRPPPTCDTRLSPDQTIRLELLIGEWSPSLWTHAPRLTEVATGRVILDLWGTSWDALAAWVGSSGLRLDLRRYDQGGILTVLIDFPAETYRFGDTAALGYPLIDIRRGIEAAFEPARQRYLDSLRSPAGIDGATSRETSPRVDHRAPLPGSSILARLVRRVFGRL